MSSNKVGLLIVAGGRGVRFGADRPKQYLSCAGRPLIVHTLEALVAAIVGDFIQNFDSKRERCWIAERQGQGEVVGSVFLVKKSKSVAKLRLLYVEPSARGLGIGRRLVEECVHFARKTGYRKITLWTQSHLDSARRIYKGAGFRLAGKKSHNSFGLDLVAETWELEL